MIEIVSERMGIHPPEVGEPMESWLVHALAMLLARIESLEAEDETLH